MNANNREDFERHCSSVPKGLVYEEYWDRYVREDSSVDVKILNYYNFLYAGWKKSYEFYNK